MAKRKSWLNRVKKFFGLEKSHSNSEKEEKRWKWAYGRLKKKRLAALTAPPKEMPVNEAEKEESNKHALTVAIDSASAAKAAVELKQCDSEIQQSSAIKIQTAFRGYLARKALRALKGIVRLQAIIRGRAVRRQAITTLKCLQSIVNIQTQVCAKRFNTAEGIWHPDENNQLQSLKEKIIRLHSNSDKRWDDSLLSKKEADVLILSKKEAAIKRERIREYSFSHRRSAESERNKVSGRWRYWLDQWVDTQLSKSKELEDLDSIFSSNSKPREDFREKPIKFKTLRQNQFEGLDSPISFTRRSSHHRKQNSLGDNNSFSTSPIVPTYMAATESAKAKSRSISSPRSRHASYDTCSDSYSPCKNKLSLISTISNDQIQSNGRIGKPSQRSPSLRGIQGPIKSSRMLNDLSIDSEFSLPNWDRQIAF